MSERLNSVSVLTAAYDPNTQYLHEAYESLQQQSIDWQWVLQLDGKQADIEVVPQNIRCDSRVEISANGEWLGVSATRNRGLLRCTHQLVQNLDADDTFFPEVIPQLAHAIRPEGVAFAFGQSHLRFPDGSSAHWQPAPWPSGLIGAGVIPQTWLSTGKHHVSLSAAMWKSAYVHAYGGWGALRGMQDVYMMLPIASDYASVYLDVPINNYRIHDSQATRQSTHSGNNEKIHRALITARLAAKALLEGKTIDVNSMAAKGTTHE